MSSRSTEPSAISASRSVVVANWLRRGIDGWRLDAAYAVPSSFWATVLPDVRSEFEQAWFVGEMIHGDYAGYDADSGLDSITQYELWSAIWTSLSAVCRWC
jgi:cyclomaltodextrinase / maltogenic alpha-amylase / neopullulanase